MRVVLRVKGYGGTAVNFVVINHGNPPTRAVGISVLQPIIMCIRNMRPVGRVEGQRGPVDGVILLFDERYVPARAVVVSIFRGLDAGWLV